MWRCHTEGTIRHVWPDDEIHDTDTLDCHCSPSTQIIEGGVVLVTHSSNDGREYIERLIDSSRTLTN